MLTLGPKVCKLDLPWVIWSPQELPGLPSALPWFLSAFGPLRFLGPGVGIAAA